MDSVSVFVSGPCQLSKIEPNIPKFFEKTGQHFVLHSNQYRQHQVAEPIKISKGPQDQAAHLPEKWAEFHSECRKSATSSCASNSSRKLDSILS